MTKCNESSLCISVKKIAQITNGVLTGGSDQTINNISTDTRTIKERSLFIALEGENFNGHDYVREAFLKGASGAIVKKGFKMTNGEQTEFLLEVDDTLHAYQDIAAYNRAISNAKIVAITGSAGKTTTKEMVRNILSVSGEAAVISEKNFNNHIGVPMTLLNIRRGHTIAVLEVGINQIDEMDRLAEITNPDIALVTNAGSSHLEFLKNVDNVAREKMKLADGLKDGGKLIFNYDDLRLLKHSQEKKADTLTYGFSDKADIVGERFEDIKLNQSKLTVRMDDEEARGLTLNMKINGKHNAYNALAAISVARALGIPERDIIQGLESFKPKDMRSENIILNRDIVLINDAYNANPDSMKAALTLFNTLESDKRKIAVLGDMNELGSYSERAHKEVGAILSRLYFHTIFFFGDQMKLAAKNAGLLGVEKKRIHWYDDHDALFDDLMSNIEDGDWVMVKGSRTTRLEIVAKKLIDKIGLKDKLTSH